jgi:hypothetical protein
MDNYSESDELRNELAGARAALTRNAHAAAADAHTLVDWRFHFRAHPWLFCSGAAAVGFLLVPARHNVVTGPAEAGSHKPRSVADGIGQVPPVTSTAASLLGIGATLLAKQALRVATRRGLAWFDVRSAPQRTTERSAATTGNGSSGKETSR